MDNKIITERRQNIYKYNLKVKGKLVRIRFSENSNLTAEDCLTNVLKNLYK